MELLAKVLIIDIALDGGKNDAQLGLSGKQWPVH